MCAKCVFEEESFSPTSAQPGMRKLGYFEAQSSFLVLPAAFGFLVVRLVPVVPIKPGPMLPVKDVEEESLKQQDQRYRRRCRGTEKVNFGPLLKPLCLWLFVC